MGTTPSADKIKGGGVMNQVPAGGAVRGRLWLLVEENRQARQEETDLDSFWLSSYGQNSVGNQRAKGI